MMQASTASAGASPTASSTQQQLQLSQSQQQQPSYVQRVQPEQFIASHLHGSRPCAYNTVPLSFASPPLLPPPAAHPAASPPLVANNNNNASTSTITSSAGGMAMGERLASYHAHFHAGFAGAPAAAARHAVHNTATQPQQAGHYTNKSATTSPWSSPPAAAAALPTASREHTNTNGVSANSATNSMTDTSTAPPQPSFVHRITYPTTSITTTTTTMTTDTPLSSSSPAASAAHQYIANTYSSSEFVYGDAPRAQPALDLVPPFRFALVADGVYRGAYPTLRNFPFLRELGLKTIVSLTPESPTYDLRAFAEAYGITLLHLQAERYKGEARLLPTDLNAALSWIIDAERQPLYIHCLDGRHVVGLVLMALRKLQHWTAAAAHAEYQRFAREVSDEMQFIADYAGPVTVPRHVCGWIRDDLTLFASSAAQGGGAAALAAMNYRGESAMRRTHSGIRLKYITTAAPAPSVTSNANNDVNAAVTPKDEAEGPEGSRAAAATTAAASSMATTPAKDEQGQALRHKPHAALSTSDISAHSAAAAAAMATHQSAHILGRADTTNTRAAELHLPGTVVVPGEGTYVDLNALQPSFALPAHEKYNNSNNTSIIAAAAGVSGQSVTDSVVRVLPTSQGNALASNAVLLVSEPASSIFMASQREHHAESSRYTNNNNNSSSTMNSTSTIATTLPAPDRSHTRRPVTEWSSTSEAMLRATTNTSHGRQRQGTSPLQPSFVVNNNNNNNSSSSVAAGTRGSSPLSAHDSSGTLLARSEEMPARLTASLSALGMSFPSALQYVEGHGASHARTREAGAEVGRPGQEGSAEDGMSSTSSRRLRRRMSL